MHAPRRAPHWRNTRPGQNIQQRCHPDFVGIQSLASISSRGVTQTLEEYTAWPAYPTEVSSCACGRSVEPQRCHPDAGGTQGQASISNRGVTQTLEGYKAWPAYPAEMPSRHWRNTRPGQNIKQRHHPDIEGIGSLASISSRGFTQTLEEY